MTITTTQESVEILAFSLRSHARNGYCHRADIKEAADMLEALAAEVATLRSAVYIDDLTVTGLADDKNAWKDRAEALAAERDALRAEVERLNEALDRSKRLRDQYREALDAEREHSNPARAKPTKGDL